MSRWAKQLAEHPIRATIEQLKEYLSVEFKDTDDEWFAEKRRLQELIVHIEQVLNSLNAEIVPFNQIDVLVEHLSQHVTPHIQNFSSTGDIESLIAANNHLTNHMSELSVLQSLCGNIAVKPKIEALNELADEFVSAVSQKRFVLEADIENLQTQLQQHEDRQQQLGNDIDAKKQETDTLSTNWQDQFSQAQEQRLNDYNSSRSKIETEARDLATNLIAENDTELSSLLSTTSETVNTLTDSTKETLEKLISEAEVKHKAILDLHEIVAGDSVAAAYINNADKECKAANFWRNFSVVFIFSSAVWMLAVFSYTAYTGNAGFNWTWYLPVFSFTGVMLYGAVYSAGQSTKHRNSEKRDRWFALQMKAIDPFISSLDEAQQKELKRELSSQLFGNAYEDDASKVITEHALVTLTKSITDIIKVSKR